jgi:hypothetical protein
MHGRISKVLLRTLFFFLAIGAGVNICAGTRDPNTPDDRYLEFGEKFPNVIRVKALIVEGVTDVNDIQTLSLAPDSEEKEPKVSFQFGSAVVIRPNWVLTAGHVVKGAPLAVAVTDDKKEYRLHKIMVHPRFEDEEFGFHDLALCYSATPFAMEFYPPLYTKLDEVGQAVTISGYGCTGTFKTGATSEDHKKRGGHNRIDSSERTILVCTPSIQNDKFPLEFMIAPGDSGGGLFIGNKLAGINSFLMAADKKPNGSYSDESAFTRISLYADWIEEQIAMHELALASKNTMAPDLHKITPIVGGELTP